MSAQQPSSLSTSQFGECPYAEADWACCKPAGHEGPHESAPVGMSENIGIVPGGYFASLLKRGAS